LVGFCVVLLATVCSFFTWWGTGWQADRLTGGQADKTSLRAAEGKKMSSGLAPMHQCAFFSQLRLYSKSNATIVQGSYKTKKIFHEV
jgi:hypothetical protein